MGNKYHVIPKIYACLLHVIIVLSMIFAFDWTEAITPEFPLTVQATLFDSAIEEMVPRENRAEAEERKKQLEDELAIEQGRLDAAISGALVKYQFALMQKIESNWIQPPSAGKGTKCVVSVTQLPGGDVISANVKSCNGDENLRRSVEAAIYKASPLPKPEDPNLYDKDLRFIFEPVE